MKKPTGFIKSIILSLIWTESGLFWSILVYFETTGSRCLPISKPNMIFQGEQIHFLMQNSSFVIRNSSFLIHNFSFLIQAIARRPSVSRSGESEQNAKNGQEKVVFGLLLAYFWYILGENYQFEWLSLVVWHYSER